MAALEFVEGEEGVEVDLKLSGVPGHLVRPPMWKHSSRSVRFIRSTKPFMRGERTFVVRP